MNLRNLILASLFSLIFCPFGEAAQKETVVEYTQFNGHPVQLVVESETSRVILRVAFSDIAGITDKASTEAALGFLKLEIERLTSITRWPISLGKSGYRFIYGGGYPIWAPHQEIHGRDVNFTCIFFAEHGKIVNHEIRGNGTEQVGYWPYVKRK
jgi:hypothetical protein